MTKEIVAIMGSVLDIQRLKNLFLIECPCCPYKLEFL